MKRFTVFSIRIFLTGFLAIPAIAQEGVSDEPIVVYDPLFWKSELKLKNSQRQSIEQINSEYYQLIESTVRNSDVSPPELKEIAKEGLLNAVKKSGTPFTRIKKKMDEALAKPICWSLIAIFPSAPCAFSTPSVFNPPRNPCCK
ncbi:MAG: hypothetical protein IPK96_20310 [Flammeovirgaceae bacterium]|nr:hypothetical protein [Flammeovirgaceae bacterium]